MKTHETGKSLRHIAVDRYNPSVCFGNPSRFTDVTQPCQKSLGRELSRADGVKQGSDFYSLFVELGPCVPVRSIAITIEGVFEK